MYLHADIAVIIMVPYFQNEKKIPMRPRCSLQWNRIELFRKLLGFNQYKSFALMPIRESCQHRLNIHDAQAVLPSWSENGICWA